MNEVSMNFNLSIIIPYYNGENFLPILLDSIVESYINSRKKLKFEIILIVDSPNSNLILINDIVEKFKFGEINILINEQNNGVAKSRDLGIKNAKGDFVTFIDQDDNVTVSYFSVLEDQLNTNIDIYIQNGYVKNILTNKKVQIFYFKPRFTLSNFLLDNHVLTPSLLIVKRCFIIEKSIHFKLPFDDYNGVDDWYFILQILSWENTLRIKWLNCFNINYCIHKSNYSNNVVEAINASIKLMEHFKTLVPKNNKLISNRIDAFKFLLCFYSNKKLSYNDFDGLIKFLKLYLFNLNRVIRFLHRFSIGLKIRLNN